MTDFKRQLDQLAQDVEQLKNDTNKTPLRIEPPQPTVSPVSDMYLFQVQQKAGSATGVYLCYKQASFGVFIPPEYEVLNLFENYTTYNVPALAAGDLISAFENTDDEGVKRWVGYPCVPCVRMVRIKQDPIASPAINCNMIGADGEEKTSGLGSGITVKSVGCGPSGPESCPLNGVAPRLQNNSYGYIVVLAGTPYFVTVFQENCNKSCTPT